MKFMWILAMMCLPALSHAQPIFFNGQEGDYLVRVKAPLSRKEKPRLVIQQVIKTALPGAHGIPTYFGVVGAYGQDVVWSNELNSGSYFVPSKEIPGLIERNPDATIEGAEFLSEKLINSRGGADSDSVMRDLAEALRKHRGFDYDKFAEKARGLYGSDLNRLPDIAKQLRARTKAGESLERVNNQAKPVDSNEAARREAYLQSAREAAESVRKYVNGVR
jgi:hypothetical protein